jgi:trimeric autotransporter adhesin
MFYIFSIINDYSIENLISKNLMVQKGDIVIDKKNRHSRKLKTLRMKKLLPFFMFLLTVQFVVAQNVGIGTTTPDASALLDISSSNKGILISRINLTNIATAAPVTAPANGLLVYNTNATIAGGSGVGFYYWSGTKWIQLVSNNNAWGITGNSGTSSTINFIGTTDNNNLVFKRNNIVAGIIDNYLNTSYGLRGLQFNSGVQNTAIGDEALSENTDGNSNTAIGFAALFQNTSGSSNSAFGLISLGANTTGNNNTANGSLTLRSNTSGFSNVAMGVSALEKNTTRSNLVAIGDSSLYNNGIGVPSSYLFEATNNTALGSKALFTNTFGAFNTANGNRALFANIDGFHNTANGAQALFSNTTGSANTAIGSASLYYNTIGYFNTSIGHDALYYNKLGANNTAIGYRSLNNDTAGNYNTAIGSNADVTVMNLSKATAIGYNAKVSASNNLILGGTGTDAVNVGIGTTETSAYGHGGTNRILDIYNDATVANAQSHVMLATASVTGSMGGITWASKGISTAEKRTAFIGTLFEAASTASAPKAAITFYTTNSGIFSEKMRITSTGGVGIGTSAPNAPLQFANNGANRKIVLYETVNNDHQYYGFGINSAVLRYQVDGTNSNHIFYAGTSATTSAELFRIIGNGNAILAGTLAQSSDIRLKKNIAPLSLSLEKLTQLNGYTYNWISKDKDPNQQIGLIAQEVQKLYPQLITEIKGENGETTLAVNYTGLIPVMIESIKEQQKQKDTQQKQIEEQAQKMNDMQKQIEELKRMIQQK